jgi:hypothetical protein
VSITKITGVSLMPVIHILKNLRPEDHEEMTAIHGIGWSAERVADMIARLAVRSCGWIFWHEDHGPVSTLGAYPITPTCAGVWAFGTPGWRHVVLLMTRHVKRSMVPMLARTGFHRAECRALTKRADTARWLHLLGAAPEAVLSEFGTRREDFTLFAWHAVDEQAPLPSRPASRESLPLRNGG